MESRSVPIIGVFVLWMHALLLHSLDSPFSNGADPVLCFLVVHGFSLILLARLPQTLLQPSVCRLCVVVGVSLTLILHLFPGPDASLLLVLIGIFAAPPAVALSRFLTDQPRPIISAALGIGLGHLLFLLLLLGERFLGNGMIPVFATLPLLLLLRPWPASPDKSRYAPPFRVALPVRLVAIVLIFFMKGLVFTHVERGSAQEPLGLAAASGAYLLALACGTRLALLHPDHALTAALAATVLGIGLGPIQEVLPVTPEVLVLHFASGLVHLFVFGVFLAQPEPSKAFGIGFGLICLGTATGIAWARSGIEDGSLAMTEHIILAAVVALLLLLPGRLRTKPVTDQEALQGHDAPGEFPAAEVFSNWRGETGDAAPMIPLEMQKMLSRQELRVLVFSIQGLTIREIAERLEISRSTVKTYLQRIYAKTQTTGKKALLARMGKQDDP